MFYYDNENAKKEESPAKKMIVYTILIELFCLVLQFFVVILYFLWIFCYTSMLNVPRTDKKPSRNTEQCKFSARIGQKM